MSKLTPALKFRDFIQVLRDENDLVEITKEVDPYLEVGAIMRKAYESNLPAPLFTNIKGASKDLFNILGCPAGLRSREIGDHGRIAHHLGLDPKTPIKEIIDFLLRCKHKKPLPPTIVSASSAPCKQHVLSEDEIHLESLPTPFLHQSDGGKYLQTYGMWILQTPDKKWTNWSIARGMVVDDKHITGLVIRPQHIRAIADSWAEIGKGDQIPFALCFGVPPAAILVSSMPIPAGQSESDYIGAILGEPIPVVKCESNDLMVPATCEMVFEGTLSMNETHSEGPFGEMHGYVFKGDGHPCPMYTVKSMTYRDNAILPVSNPGLCTDETHTLIGSLVAAEAKQLAMESDLPVLDAFTPYEAQALWLVLRVDLAKLQALKTNPEEFCKKVGDLYFNSKVGFIIHEIVLVADDIDIFNFREVIWAYVTRHTPVSDQIAFDDVTSFPLAPFVSQSPRNKTLKGGKCVTNCIFRQQYVGDLEYVTCDFEKGYPKELTESINKNWESFGYI